MIDLYWISQEINITEETGPGEIIKGGPLAPRTMPQTKGKTNSIDRKKEKETIRGGKKQGRVQEKTTMNILWKGCT